MSIRQNISNRTDKFLLYFTFCFALIICGCAAKQKISPAPGPSKSISEYDYYNSYKTYIDTHYKLADWRKYQQPAERYVMTLTTYGDADRDYKSYKTFAFDYIDSKNPLLEKHLFKIVEKYLIQEGLKRLENNPDLLITMSFYVGKKKSYVPPKTITTTRIKSIWTTSDIWGPSGTFTHLGSISGEQIVPVTESYTRDGYTVTSYYRNIRLNFLDYKELKSKKDMKIPPLAWLGEVESTGKSSDIRRVAKFLLAELVYEFHKQRNSAEPLDGKKHRAVCKTRYSAIGVKLDQTDRRIIREVLPGSPAETAGLGAGDIILKVGKKKTVPQTIMKGSRIWWRPIDPYFKSVINYGSGSKITLLIKSAATGKKSKVIVVPEEIEKWHYCANTVKPVWMK